MPSQFISLPPTSCLSPKFPSTFPLQHSPRGTIKLPLPPPPFTHIPCARPPPPSPSTSTIHSIEAYSPDPSESPPPFPPNTHQRVPLSSPTTAVQPKLPSLPPETQEAQDYLTSRPHHITSEVPPLPTALLMALTAPASLVQAGGAPALPVRKQQKDATIHMETASRGPLRNTVDDVSGCVVDMEDLSVDSCQLTGHGKVGIDHHHFGGGAAGRDIPVGGEGEERSIAAHMEGGGGSVPVLRQAGKKSVYQEVAGLKRAGSGGGAGPPLSPRGPPALSLAGQCSPGFPGQMESPFREATGDAERRETTSTETAHHPTSPSLASASATSSIPLPDPPPTLPPTIHLHLPDYMTAEDSSPPAPSSPLAAPALPTGNSGARQIQHARQRSVSVGTGTETRLQSYAAKAEEGWKAGEAALAGEKGKGRGTEDRYGEEGRKEEGVLVEEDAEGGRARDVERGDDDVATDFGMEGKGREGGEDGIIAAEDAGGGRGIGRDGELLEGMEASGEDREEARRVRELGPSPDTGSSRAEQETEPSQAPQHPPSDNGNHSSPIPIAAPAPVVPAIPIPSHTHLLAAFYEYDVSLFSTPWAEERTFQAAAPTTMSCSSSAGTSMTTAAAHPAYMKSMSHVAGEEGGGEGRRGMSASMSTGQMMGRSGSLADLALPPR